MRPLLSPGLHRGVASSPHGVPDLQDRCPGGDPAGDLRCLMVEIDSQHGDMGSWLAALVEKTIMMSIVFFCPWGARHAAVLRAASPNAAIYIACDGGVCIDTAKELPAQGVAIRWTNSDPASGLNRMHASVRLWMLQDFGVHMITSKRLTCRVTLKPSRRAIYRARWIPTPSQWRMPRYTML
jgi:hypothetical protein